MIEDNEEGDDIYKSRTVSFLKRKWAAPLTFVLWYEVEKVIKRMMKEVRGMKNHNPPKQWINKAPEKNSQPQDHPVEQVEYNLYYYMVTLTLPSWGMVRVAVVQDGREKERAID